MNDGGRQRDVLAIRGVVADTERLQNDVDGFTGLLTEDVVIVNFGGRRVRGRDRLREAMQEALATPLADVLTRNELEDIHFLRPDVALVACVKHVFDERDQAAKDARRPLQPSGRLTFVLTKEQGRWLVAAAQTTPITT
jgi:uncharacterized protein (TIGR02246 family)